MYKRTLTTKNIIYSIISFRKQNKIIICLKYLDILLDFYVGCQLTHNDAETCY